LLRTIPAATAFTASKCDGLGAMVISTTRAILFLFFVSSDSSRREK
jgi:hypothetical protein